MIVLGADPGFASFGIAVVRLDNEGEHIEKLDVIRTKKSARKRRVLAADDNHRRSREIGGALELIREGWDVFAVCAESMSFPRSASVAGKMCLAWGVFDEWMRALDVPLVQASPQAIKLATCGANDASKADVENAMRGRFGAALDRHLSHIPKTEQEHPVDALAAVVACLNSDVILAMRKATRRAGLERD